MLKISNKKKNTNNVSALALISLSVLFLSLGYIRGGIFGNEMFLHVNLLNRGASDINNAHVTVFIPSINEMFYSFPFDITSSVSSAYVIEDLSAYNMPHGLSLAKVTATNGRERASRWVYIYNYN